MMITNMLHLAVGVFSPDLVNASYELEEAFFPQASWIIDAIHECIILLEGHVPTNDFPISEKIDRNA